MNKQTIGTVPVGEALLGRAINVAGEQIDGGEPIVGLRHLPIDGPASAGHPAPDGQMLTTGIKVIDLYAPIVRGGTIPMIAVPGTGMIVNSTELIHSIAAHQGGCAVIADLDDQVFSSRELMAELRSGGIDRHTALLMGQQDESPDARRQLGLMGLTLAEYFAEQGRETLLFLHEQLVSPDTIERLRARRHGAQAAVTLLVWHVRKPETIDPGEIVSKSLLKADGQLVFSLALAKQSIWPAVDPLASGSRLLAEQRVSAEHVRVAGATRELLAGHSILAGDKIGGDPLLQGRARRALLFQSQPFVVAETFTGVPGVHVPLEETLRGFGEIVAGTHDATDETAFRFTGAIGASGDRG